MAVMTGAIHIRKSEISVKVLASIKKDLTRKFTPYGASESHDVIGYVENRLSIYIPRVYGQYLVDRHLSHTGIKLEDHTFEGHETNLPMNVTPRPYQVPVIDEMVNHLKLYGDLQMKAATGMGKTVMAIATAIRMKVNTLIVVDQMNLAGQWEHDNLLNPEMFNLADECVGHVGAGRIDYKGKAFVVATIQTITRSKELDDDFFNYFGLVIFDEAHTTSAADSYQTALFDINARYRLTLTATPRSDVYGYMQEQHVGKVDIVLEKEHKPSSVRYVVNESVYSWYANTSKMAGRILSDIAEDTERNLLCVKILTELYNSGRVILVLGDRVQHLQMLMNFCAMAGIPENVMGMYVGEQHIPVMKKQAVEPRSLKGLRTGIDYCPIEINFKKSKVKTPRLEEIKETCSIIFATYKVFDKGVDLPSLNAGLDVTPRAKSQQAHGRILRSETQKVKPVWVTIRDINNSRLEHTFSSRLKDYDRSNGEISEWNLEKGIRKVNFKELLQDVKQNIATLKTMQITKSSWGVIELTKTGSRPTSKRDNDTKKRQSRRSR